ncbi:MAG TPA: helix-turn-helix domain-containing protein [Patescibacteria group bacterium]|nr:helix-turn-helix domain-containing protein [Patescibacteria group bacterium]
MEIFQELKSIGLNPSQSKVYLYLVETGLSTPLAIAKGVNIARTNTYNILKQLQEMGLVELQKKGSHNAYLARNPSSLIALVQRQKEAVEKILPDLQGLFTTQKNKPKIRFYEGWTEVQELYKLTLHTHALQGLGSTAKLEKLDAGFFEWFQKAIAKKKIVLQEILTHHSAPTIPAIKEHVGALHDARLFPQKYEDIPTDIFIWEDNIAFITLEEPIFGTLITNAHLAHTFKIIFQILWAQSA